MWWLGGLAGCMVGQVKLDVLDGEDAVVFVVGSVPVDRAIVLGEPLSATDCEAPGHPVDLQALMDQARGSYNLLVQMTIERRTVGTCVGRGSRRAIESWRPSVSGCLDEAQEGHVRERFTQARTCYTVAGRGAYLARE